MTALRLVVDAGGSNVRFARTRNGGDFLSAVTYATAKFATFPEAMNAYFEETGPPDEVVECVIAAAGPVDGGVARLTNATWVIRTCDAAARLGGVPVALINDLEAVAAALPHLAVADVTRLGGPDAASDCTANKLAFNIGTGCGAAVALSCAGAWRTLASEAGHMSLYLGGEEPLGLSPGATVEDILSGGGVAALYAAYAARVGLVLSEAPGAAAILGGAANREATRATIDALTRLIGRVTGDLVLATGAWGGVYLAGSVATAWARSANPDIFRTAFENKGKMRERMARVPTYAVNRPDVALFGLAHLDMIRG